MDRNARDGVKQCKTRELATTLPRSRSERAEGFHHVSEDQDVPVVPNGRARMNPREANVERQVWRSSTQLYHIKDWSTTEIMKQDDVNC